METAVWLLAVYGGVRLVLGMWRWVLSVRHVPPQVGLLFIVRDNEDLVEGLFRQLALDCFFSNRFFTPDSVVAVDLGSIDQTPEILRRLAREFSFLHFRTCQEANLAELIARLGQVLVLDMRSLSSRQALNATRYMYNRNVPQEQHQAVTRQRAGC